MNVAAKVAATKKRHPDQFCSVTGCLWRTFNPITGWRSPCKKHPKETTR